MNWLLSGPIKMASRSLFSGRTERGPVGSQ
jgi:hypothetical protein